IRGQPGRGFVALVCGEENLDVEGPEPEPAHARVSRRHELFGLAAELLSFLNLAAPKSHFSKTSERFEMCVQQTRRRALKIFFYCFQRLVVTSLHCLDHSEAGSEQSQHAVLSNRFGERDAVEKLLFCTLYVAEEDRTLRRVVMRPRATFT